jgi:hypothetical protein
MKAKLICGAVIGLCLALSMARADSLELKNGSLIKSTFMGGSESEVTFQVGSSVQRYSLGDIVSLRFDSDPDDLQARPDGSPAGEPGAAEHAGVRATEYVTIPVGTRISVRTIDAIDSTKNHVGDRFQASLEELLMVD